MILIITLFVLALLFMVWPNFIRHETGNSQQQENIRLYEQRRQEILDAGYADEEEVAALLELDRELLSTTAEEGAISNEQPKGRLLFSFALFMAMSASVVWLYDLYGAQDEIQTAELLDKMARAQLSQPEQVALTEGLAAAVDKHPENTDWRYIYARFLTAQGQHQASIEHYDALLAQVPLENKADRAAVMVQKAQAQFYANQGADKASYQLIQQVLSLAPEHRQGIGLAGIMAFDLEEYDAALVYWKTLWLQLKGSPDAQPLELGIRRVAAKLESQGQTVDLSWMMVERIAIQVSLDEALKSEVAPSDVVFVLAKAPAGPPMPLAAVRLTAAQLPLQVELSDYNSMMPGVSLSQHEEVQVIARISKSGQPVASSGDLQGVVEHVSTDGSAQVAILIDQRIP